MACIQGAGLTVRPDAYEKLIALAVLLVVIVGPLVLGVRGRTIVRREPQGVTPEGAASWDWKLTITSALLYALAFNLVFFIQELFLVLPKAFTPGLRPTLFHNNHLWQGVNPLANLFQGTGALATLITGLICILLVSRRPYRSSAVRLFLIWWRTTDFCSPCRKSWSAPSSPRTMSAWPWSTCASARRRRPPRHSRRSSRSPR